MFRKKIRILGRGGFLVVDFNVEWSRGIGY